MEDESTEAEDLGEVAGVHAADLMDEVDNVGTVDDADNVDRAWKEECSLVLVVHQVHIVHGKNEIHEPGLPLRASRMSLSNPRRLNGYERGGNN